ncbi:hypothetical protein MTR67_016345 [Solanum verrucosum]|uniref:Bet v I/Major latex protein domain-containing protein n=1 Tax=Solanum verrucosum TaxID=315347 RepID=A0AAF0TR88_SOLVR|nr:hypothetical protein MTR67_016345 [Solanum verrucosum]
MVFKCRPHPGCRLGVDNILCICSDKIQNMDIHEGELGNIGSVKSWKFTHGKSVFLRFTKNDLIQFISLDHLKSKISSMQYLLYLFAGGKEIVVKEVIEEIDDEKKLIKKKIIQGDLLEYYKSFYVTIQVEIKGENNLVTWIMNYEKKNANVPDPHTYMELCLNVTKDIGLTISSDT